MPSLRLWGGGGGVSEVGVARGVLATPEEAAGMRGPNSQRMKSKANAWSIAKKRDYGVSHLH